MGQEIKIRIQQKHDTTANWNAAIGFIPLKGEIIVYDDYIQGDKTISNIKIGDGLAYVQDLPFITEAMSADIREHINNLTIHVTATDKLNWNNKTSYEVNSEQEELILFKENIF